MMIRVTLLRPTRPALDPAMKVLLIEDDTMVGRAIEEGLRRAGFAVDWVRDGVGGAASLADHNYDLAVLDLGLPGRDGLAVLQNLRQRGQRLPVLVVTARDALRDRVAGLEAGADDYLLKPFDLEELVVRVRALLRRAAGNAQLVLTAGALTLDPVRKLVALEGALVELSAREFAVLEALMQRPGAVLSRKELEDTIYGWGEEVASNAIEVHLHNLRRKIGSQRIRNVRGVGYRISDGGP
jgi:two-component system, OmpR family, response regulator QseB